MRIVQNKEKSNGQSPNGVERRKHTVTIEVGNSPVQKSSRAFNIAIFFLVLAVFIAVAVFVWVVTKNPPAYLPLQLW